MGKLKVYGMAQSHAALPNFEILETAWGESDWRGELIEPAQLFTNGEFKVGEEAGIGITLNESVLAVHS